MSPPFITSAGYFSTFVSTDGRSGCGAVEGERRVSEQHYSSGVTACDHTAFPGAFCGGGGGALGSGSSR